MTPLIRFALGLLAGGLAVKTLRNTVFKDKGVHRPSDTPPNSSPVAVNEAPPAMAKKRASTAARTRRKPAASSTKSST